MCSSQIAKFFKKSCRYKPKPIIFKNPEELTLESFTKAMVESDRDSHLNFWDILDDIQYSLRNVKYSVQSVFVGLYNFWKYRKVIYNDRWWDHAFLTDWMEIKIKDMHDNWDRSHYENYQKEKETLRQLLIYLDKMKQEEDADENISKFFELLSKEYRNLWD